MGKFLWAARWMRKKRIIILWSGSDVLHAQDALSKRERSSWVTEKIHWAVSPWVAQEVRSMGLACEYVQASFVEPVPTPAPLPKKFSVLVYVASVEKQALYGWDRMAEVADKLRSVEFNLVGLERGQTLKGPPNIKVHNRVHLAPFLAKSTVLYRPVRHDGLSFMVLEALAHGRHVLYSYPLSACIQVTDVETACVELLRLQRMHESGALGPNWAGIELIERDYRPDKVRADLLRRWEKVILMPDTELRKPRKTENRAEPPAPADGSIGPSARRAELNI